MNSCEIYGVEILGNALKVNDNLIITDLHFGYESSLNNNGFMVPPFQNEKIINLLTDIQKKSNVNSIIVNGDIKHNFATISKQEWKEVLDFIDYLLNNYTNITLIKGNHDNFTQYITKKRNLNLKEKVYLNNYLITHGHKIPEKIPEKIDTIIIGHEHPCISIKSNERIEKFKTYLKGYWKKYKLIVQPSFTQVSCGSDVLHEKTISPFINKLQKFEVYAIENYDVYPFGKIEDILSIEEKN